MCEAHGAVGEPDAESARGCPTSQQGACGAERDTDSGPQSQGHGRGAGGARADIPGRAAGNDIQARRVDLGSRQALARRGGGGRVGTEDVAPRSG